MNQEINNLKSTPKDVFLYLLSTIALYVSVGSFIAVVFALIDNFFPDTISYIDPVQSARWWIAVLTIVFPVYVWTIRFVSKDVDLDNRKADLRIRKWLLYLTIFLAAVLLIGDLIALLYQFLEGSLTSRFLLKVLTILLVAGGVFRYYIDELRRPAPERAQEMKAISWVAIGLVLIVLISGFVQAGSPFRQRLVKFDSERVYDLSSIQDRLTFYWQQKGFLPDRLEELNDPISSYLLPKDPEKNVDYEYRKTGEKSFELCANFSLKTGSVNQRTGYRLEDNPNWHHDAGRVCFSRNIDSDLYPVKPDYITR